MARTLFDNIWDPHVVEELGDGMQLMFVDRHLIHELSGHRGQVEIAKRGLKMRNPELAVGSMDHVISTAPGSRGDIDRIETGAGTDHEFDLPRCQHRLGYFRAAHDEHVRCLLADCIRERIVFEIRLK